ncbi:hypothetical protein PDESU_02046 [Pontiella desulfatans]|uniref:Uncharacterized protein n=1 Tax=Pontiella desulfatans TaxID=2750659 RepID=A0A6C2U0Z0_PONDE|nr:replication-relaxation family protein [Pontiella desulfatans]VGO13489.1 hypothetical protein PDESU_02046 [Pontiella desulfatans]
MPADKDINLMVVAAELRVSTPIQLAQFLDTSEQMVRRRTRRLAADGLLNIGSRGIGRRRGRPENLFSVTESGVQFLKEHGRLDACVKPSSVTDSGIGTLIDHQVMLNSVRCALEQTVRLKPELTLRFISSTSPSHVKKTGAPIISDHVESADGESFSFTPDAVFCLTDTTQDKGLLFFMEIDMGTERVAARKSKAISDVRRKVLVYRTYLGRNGYKRYEDPNWFNRKLLGFRVLLVTSSTPRLESLCTLTREMAPSDFVWLTCDALLIDSGLDAPVWHGGGEESPYSIMGANREVESWKSV